MNTTVEKYTPACMQALLRLMTRDPFVKNDMESMLTCFPKYAFVSREADVITGVAVFSGKQVYSDLALFVGEQYRNSGVGDMLIKTVLKKLNLCGICRVSCNFAMPDEVTQTFLSKHGFEDAYRVCMLTRPTTERFTPVNVCNYKDEYYPQVSQIFYDERNEAKHALGRPIMMFAPNEEQRRSFLLDSKNIFCLSTADNICAAAILRENEIVILGVNQRLRGEGFGMSLLQFMLHIINARGYDTASVWCHEPNPIFSLYTEAGFVVTRVHKVMELTFPH